MLKVKINNVTVFTKPKASILEVCQSIGIKIPRFCYHEKLSVAGNCRMCLVEIENLPKPVVSCSMPVMNDMKIYTSTPLVKKARENILELLLLNHPLDCPICDQGGECDLQDQALVYGSDVSRFYEYKRGVADKNIGPLIKTIMTRCIHCTRCVRFAQEIAGVEDLGTLLRGTDTEIGTYVDKLFKSEISGNVIDLCPVGALTSKVYSFAARPWELKTYESIDCSDGMGSNIKIDVKNNKIVRVMPKYCESINEDWISDKTRFVFDSIFSNRKEISGPSLTVETPFQAIPLVRQYKWSSVFKEITNSIYVLNHFYNFSNKEGDLLIVVGNNVDLETAVCLEQLNKEFDFIKIRKESSPSINSDFSDDFLTKINNDYLSNSTFCCLVGVNTRYESSVFNIKLRKRYLSGGFSVAQIGPFKNLTFLSSSVGLTSKKVISIVNGTSSLCQQFVLSRNPIIIIGPNVFKHENFSKIFNALENLKSLLKINSLVHYLHSNSNEVGFCFLNELKSVTVTDFKKSKAYYFVENTFEEKIFENFLSLGYSGLASQKRSSELLFALNQNSHLTNDNFFLRDINKRLSQRFFVKYSLPSTTFFEKKSRFFNSYGMMQKTTKALNISESFKNSLSVFLVLIGNLQNNINVTSNDTFIVTPKLHLDKFRFTEFLNFLLPKHNKINCNTVKPKSTFSIKQTKTYNNKFVSYVDNFYVEGGDVLSKNSKTMRKCSILFKNNFTNFNQKNIYVYI